MYVRTETNFSDKIRQEKATNNSMADVKLSDAADSLALLMKVRWVDQVLPNDKYTAQFGQVRR